MKNIGYNGDFWQQTLEWHKRNKGAKCFADIISHMNSDRGKKIAIC